ncbi:MAG: hypothetical protein Aureis2KO_27690 [Aureisphaera sp.]
MRSAVLLFALLCSYFSQGQVAIGKVGVESSAIFEVFSTDEGILFPRLDTSERNGLSNPANGLIIYNTDNNALEHNSGSPGAPVWELINTEAASTSYISQSAKFSNTDTSTNINDTPAIDLPVFGTEEWNDNSSLFVVSGNSLQVTEDGRYNININVSLLSNSTNARKAPEIYITVNDVRTGSYASTGYLRRNSGHEEASLHLNEVLSLTATDIIKVQIVRSANGSTAILRSTGSTNFYIEKVN